MSRLQKQRVLIIAFLFGGIFSETPPSLGQSVLADAFQESVIWIGETPDEWNFYTRYWQQLIELNAGSMQKPSTSTSPSKNSLQSSDRFQELAKNIKVQNFRQDYILKLNGSSQITGAITNYNRDTVVVQSVNFEIRDRQGQLIQTGSSIPTPSRIAPGQTVTFSETLLTLPVDPNYQIRLANPAFSLAETGENAVVSGR